MGIALYRKYRSRSLDEVVGQQQVTTLLKGAIAKGRVAHAYLFTGPRGSGKTSVARILAHQINGLDYVDERHQLDIIEIDAASNNGVEDIRDLREKVQIAPVHADKKVYIIDEVHMLSKPAFNALLKTLEEPPSHVVFILATTDLDKVPDTIISRTQRHSFKRASLADLLQNLERIAKAEKLNYQPHALELIAKHSDGSYRDSVSLLDQLMSILDEKDGLTKALVASNLGLVADDEIDQLIDATISHDTTAIVRLLDELESAGTSAKIIVSQLTTTLSQQIVKQPQLLGLLDALLAVSKSSHPHLKLMTTLCLYARPNSNQSANAKALDSTPSKQSKKKPADDLIYQDEKPKEAIKKPAMVTTKSKDLAKEKLPSKPKSSTASEPFNWLKLLDYVKTNHIAIHSVLAKCQPVLTDNKLTLYTNSVFYKKKLDDSRYKAILSSSLDHVGQSELEVDISSQQAPLKDTQAARVAVIMGGGEVVDMEEDGN